MYYTISTTPIGEMLLAGDSHGLARVRVGQEQIAKYLHHSWQRDDARFAEAQEQILQYLAGTRRSFTVPLNPMGTPFQLLVWQQLGTIPYGCTASYKDIAVKLGKPTACRAVGMANSRNPLPLLIPCHRVITVNGAVGGYVFGSSLKTRLLKLEQREASRLTG